MDSMMTESNIRKLSRMELICTCIAKLARYIDDIDTDILPDDLKHYIDPNDFNRVIYHQRSTDADNRMNQLLTDADKLLSVCEPEYQDSTEDEQNNHSDSRFIREHLEQMDVQDEKTVMVADGAYSGTENRRIAADKNVELITTSLTGREAPDILADFEFNEEGTKVLRCPAGYEPKSCSFRKQSNQCAVSFLHEQCAGCPYQNQCKPKIFKRVAKIVTSKAAHERAKKQRNMNGEAFKNYARLRNGVETVASNIRNNYHLEKLPRGKQRGKFFFGAKIAALNFRKLFNFRKGLGNYAKNPVLA